MTNKATPINSHPNAKKPGTQTEPPKLILETVHYNRPVNKYRKIVAEVACLSNTNFTEKAAGQSK